MYIHKISQKTNKHFCSSFIKFYIWILFQKGTKNNNYRYITDIKTVVNIIYSFCGFI